MNELKQNNKKGFTIVELLVAIAVGMIVLTFVVDFLSTIVRRLEPSTNEFKMQTTMRSFSESIKNEVINASSIYMLEANSFKPEKIVNSKGWDYIGVENVMIEGSPSSQLVWYQYEPKMVGTVDEGKHKRVTLTDTVAGLTYDVTFAKPSEYKEEEHNVLEFQLTGFLSRNGTPVPSEVIDGTIRAQNSKIINNWTGKDNKTVAIAFRKDYIDGDVQRGQGMINLILDCSGSMFFNIDDGGYGNQYTGDRSLFLRRAVNKLIDTFEEQPNVYMNIEGFEGISKHNPVFNSQDPVQYPDKIDPKQQKIYSLGGEDYLNLRKIFNPDTYFNRTTWNAFSADPANAGAAYIYKMIAPGGSTNLGDALRMSLAYHDKDVQYIKNQMGFGDSTEIISHMVVVADGMSNQRTIEKSTLQPYFGDVHYKKRNWYMGSGGQWIETTQTNNDDVMFLSTDGKEFYPTSNPNDFPAIMYPALVMEKIAAKGSITDVFFVAIGPSSYESLLVVAEAAGINVNDPDEAASHIFKTTSEIELSEAFENLAESISFDMAHLYGPER